MPIWTLVFVPLKSLLFTMLHTYSSGSDKKSKSAKAIAPIQSELVHVLL